MPITFPNGSADGAEICTPLTAYADNLVECEEDFGVILTLLTSAPSLSLGNNLITVTLIDGDGRLHSSAVYL